MADVESVVAEGHTAPFMDSLGMVVSDGELRHAHAAFSASVDLQTRFADFRAYIGEVWGTGSVGDAYPTLDSLCVAEARVHNAVRGVTASVVAVADPVEVAVPVEAAPVEVAVPVEAAPVEIGAAAVPAEVPKEAKPPPPVELLKNDGSGGGGGGVVADPAAAAADYDGVFLDLEPVPAISFLPAEVVSATAAPASAVITAQQVMALGRHAPLHDQKVAGDLRVLVHPVRGPAAAAIGSQADDDDLFSDPGVSSSATPSPPPPVAASLADLPVIDLGLSLSEPLAAPAAVAQSTRKTMTEAPLVRTRPPPIVVAAPPPTKTTTTSRLNVSQKIVAKAKPPAIASTALPVIDLDAAATTATGVVPVRVAARQKPAAKAKPAEIAAPARPATVLGTSAAAATAPKTTATRLETRIGGAPAVFLTPEQVAALPVLNGEMVKRLQAGRAIAAGEAASRPTSGVIAQKKILRSILKTRLAVRRNKEQLQKVMCTVINLVLNSPTKLEAFRKEFKPILQQSTRSRISLATETTTFDQNSSEAELVDGLLRADSYDERVALLKKHADNLATTMRLLAAWYDSMSTDAEVEDAIGTRYIGSFAMCFK